MCTGYDFDFPLLENGALLPVKNNEVELYKYMYPLELSLHNTLAVVGFVQVWRM
jgi:dimethylaniline monooxygenase (N-oxide forming)